MHLTLQSANKSFYITESPVIVEEENRLWSDLFHFYFNLIIFTFNDKNYSRFFEFLVFNFPLRSRSIRRYNINLQY